MKVFRLLYPFLRNALKERCNAFSYSSLATDSARDLVDYLVAIWGFSSAEAAKVCQRAQSRSPSVQNLERVVDFLRESGLSDAQIRKAITRNHQLLGLRIEKTLMPKMKAFQDWGLSTREIAQMVTTNPNIFNSSLEKALISTVGVLKTVLQGDKNLGGAIKSLFSGARTAPKVETLEAHLSKLRSSGVPHSSIWKMLVSYPRIFRYNPSSLERAVEKAYQFGFDPSSSMLPSALATLCGFKESVWNSKVDILKGFGWSEKNVAEAFRKAPLFMGLSKSILQRKLDYFINELNVTASVLATAPYFFTYSLDKRVIPRVAVMSRLKSSEIVLRDWSLTSILTCSEKNFCKRIVSKHMTTCPEVVQMYSNIEKRKKKKSDDDDT